MKGFHFGIIDYLQAWDLQKKVERLFKTCVNRGIKDKLSAVPARQYQERFERFMREKVITQMKETSIGENEKRRFIEKLREECGLENK